MSRPPEWTPPPVAETALQAQLDDEAMALAESADDPRAFLVGLLEQRQPRARQPARGPRRPRPLAPRRRRLRDDLRRDRLAREGARALPDLHRHRPRRRRPGGPLALGSRGFPARPDPAPRPG